MARYFPISRAQEFQNVQRVFGCSNMIKMYNSVPVQSHDAFMETIVYEAKMRQKHPVEGCLKVIRELSMQIEVMKTELPIMKKQVEMQNVQVQITEVPLKQTPQFGGEILQPLLPTSFNPNTVNCGYDSSSSNSPSLNVHLDAQMVQSGAVMGPHILQDSSFPNDIIMNEPGDIKEQEIEVTKLIPSKQEQPFGGEQMHSSSSTLFNPENIEAIKELKDSQGKLVYDKNQEQGVLLSLQVNAIKEEVKDAEENVSGNQEQEMWSMISLQEDIKKAAEDIKKAAEDIEGEIVSPKNEGKGGKRMKLLPLKQEQQPGGELQPSSSMSLTPNKGNRECNSFSSRRRKLKIRMNSSIRKSAVGLVKDSSAGSKQG